MYKIVLINTFLDSEENKPSFFSDIQKSVLSLITEFNIVPVLRDSNTSLNAGDKIIIATVENDKSEYCELYGYSQITETILSNSNWDLEDIYNSYVRTNNSPYELFMFSKEYKELYSCDEIKYFKRKVQINLNTFLNNYIQSNTENISELLAHILELNQEKISALLNNIDVGIRDIVVESLGLDFYKARKLLENVEYFRNDLLFFQHIMSKKDYHNRKSMTEGKLKRIQKAAEKRDTCVSWEINQYRTDIIAELNEELSSPNNLHYAYPFENEKWQLDFEFIKEPRRQLEDIFEAEGFKTVMVLDNQLYSEGIRDKDGDGFLILNTNNSSDEMTHTYYAPDGKILMYNEQDKEFFLNLIELKVSYTTDTNEIQERELKWLEQIRKNLGIYNPEQEIRYMNKNNIQLINNLGINKNILFDDFNKRKTNSIYKDIEIFTQYAVRATDDYMLNSVVENSYEYPYLWEKFAQEFKEKLKEDFFIKPIHYTFIINSNVTVSENFFEIAKRLIKSYGCIPHIYTIYRYYNYFTKEHYGEVNYNLEPK